MPYDVHIPPKKKLVYNLHICTLCNQFRNLVFDKRILASNFWVTSCLTKTTLYGESSPSMTGRVTPRDDPHRERVTGGILRISSMKDMSARSVFAAVGLA